MCLSAIFVTYLYFLICAYLLYIFVFEFCIFLLGIYRPPTNTLDENIFKDTKLWIGILLNAKFMGSLIYIFEIFLF